ncbi:MAG: tetratricopeptide repeat protein [Ignavibacteriales bacterium]|nr:tetratricopeptide repeat protein [Ignavibacteriales bacterium]
MDTTEFDIEFLTQKLSENPHSPLFARLADLFAAKDQTVEALNLCEEGIKVHPQYYAGYIALGKTHLVLKEYSKARAAFERAHELAPFNHAIEKLITSVPDKPDESTRMTDENYFAPSPEQQQPAEQVQDEQPLQTEAVTVQQSSEPQFESPTAEEMGFTQSAEEIDTAAVSDQQPVAASSEQAFPTFDEYIAQNQSQPNAGPVSTLDEYLGGALPQAQLQREFVPDEPGSTGSVVRKLFSHRPNRHNSSLR